MIDVSIKWLPKWILIVYGDTPFVQPSKLLCCLLSVFIGIQFSRLPAMG